MTSVALKLFAMSLAIKILVTSLVQRLLMTSIPVQILTGSSNSMMSVSLKLFMTSQMHHFEDYILLKKEKADPMSKSKSKQFSGTFAANFYNSND